MKQYLTILLLLVFGHSEAQKPDVEYRTVEEDDLPLHYLIFSDHGECTLKFGPLNHPQAMFQNLLKRKSSYDLHFKTENDTITITTDKWVNPDSNRLVDRLLHARFIVKDHTLYDCNSGYTYFDKKRVRNSFIYAIDGHLYRQKNPKTSGNGLIMRSLGTNYRLKRKLKSIKLEDYNFTILRGQEAYLKYGIPGVNGVIEISKL